MKYLKQYVGTLKTIDRHFPLEGFFRLYKDKIEQFSPYLTFKEYEVRNLELFGTLPSIIVSEKHNIVWIEPEILLEFEIEEENYVDVSGFYDITFKDIFSSYYNSRGGLGFYLSFSTLSSSFEIGLKTILNNVGKTVIEDKNTTIAKKEGLSKFMPRNPMKLEEDLFVDDLNLFCVNSGKAPFVVKPFNRESEDEDIEFMKEFDDFEKACYYLEKLLLKQDEKV